MTTTPRLSSPWSIANTAHQPAPMSAGLPSQDDGQVVSLNDGGYVVVWTDFSRTYNPAGAAVIGQRYNSPGNKIGGEVKLSGFNSGDQFSPAVTRLDNGNIAVAFVDQFAGDRDIWVSTFNSSLNLVRTDFIDVSANQTFDPSITAFADSSYVLSYTVGTATEVVARIVSPTGTVGAQFDIDSHTAFFTSEDLSELATLSNGNFVAVNQIRSSAADTDIEYTIFSPTGTVLKGTFAVAGASGLGLETAPDVAALRDGGFVVVWTDPDSTVNDIRATIYSNTGLTTPATSNILVNTTTTGDQKWASVVALADGGFLVTWDDASGPKFVHAQRFDAAGTKIGTEATVLLPDFFEVPQAAVLTDGRIAYAIADGNVGGSETFVVTSMWSTGLADGHVHDFNGNGKSDMLWQGSDGTPAIWLMDGMNAVTAGAAGSFNPGPSWHVKESGDFNGDGKSDILWQNDDGTPAIWLMNGSHVLANSPAGSFNPGPTWHIKATGDFNGDSKSDILWQNDNGTPAIWLMNGSTVLANGPAGSFNPGPTWQIKDTGDFNGDGMSDILWQGADGTAAIWLMNGSTVLANSAAGPFNPGSSWQIKGTGDFNGDGMSDILWQNTNGQAAIWLMNGVNATAVGAVGPFNPGPNWHIQGTGDYDRDGRSDILWQADDGTPAIWLMNGLNFVAGGAAGSFNPGHDWHIIA